MTKDPAEIFARLSSFLKEYTPPLQVTDEKADSLEVKGTKEAMQGKQKVDAFYFASLVTKPKDVRLYFFPIYTHPKAFQNISEDMQKTLKGKSCFHIKKLDESMEKEIRELFDKGVKIYKREGLV